MTDPVAGPQEQSVQKSCLQVPISIRCDVIIVKGFGAYQEPALRMRSDVKMRDS